MTPEQVEEYKAHLREHARIHMAKKTALVRTYVRGPYKTKYSKDRNVEEPVPQGRRADQGL